MYDIGVSDSSKNYLTEIAGEGQGDSLGFGMIPIVSINSST